MTNLTEFEKEFIVDVLERHRRELRTLNIKGLGTINRVVEKLSDR